MAQGANAFGPAELSVSKAPQLVSPELRTSNVRSLVSCLKPHNWSIGSNLYSELRSLPRGPSPAPVGEPGCCAVVVLGYRIFPSPPRKLLVVLSQISLGTSEDPQFWAE